MKALVLFVLVASVAMAREIRLHNGTPESMTFGVTVVASGAVELLELEAGVLVYNRTNSAGVFESWAVEAATGSLVSLQPLGRWEVSESGETHMATLRLGFVTGCVMELLGLMIRVVRKTTTQTTGI